MIKPIKYSLIFILTACSFLQIFIFEAKATLGNSIEMNEAVFGTKGTRPKYNFGGAKDVVIYKKDNFTITVVYRNNVSILEDITFKNAVSTEEAMASIKEFILPNHDETPQFSSSMMFAEGYFKEDLYKNGVKTKMLFNNQDQVTEVISSVQLSNQVKSK